MQPKGAVENGALSLKRRILTQQPVAASGLRGDPAKADAGTGAAALEPGDSEGGYFTFLESLSAVLLNCRLTILIGSLQETRLSWITTAWTTRRPVRTIEVLIPLLWLASRASVLPLTTSQARTQ